MWFKKSKPDPVNVEEMVIEILKNFRDIQIHHKVEHTFAPRPVQKPPTTIVFRCINNRGEEWTMNPMQIFGQSSSKVWMPLYHITGRTEDNGIQVGLDARLYYEGN